MKAIEVMLGEELQAMCEMARKALTDESDPQGGTDDPLNKIRE